MNDTQTNTTITKEREERYEELKRDLEEERKTTFPLRYLVMPDFIYKDNTVSDIARRIYSFIYSYREGKFYFSNKRLAEMFCVSERTIARGVLLLEKKKIIKTKREIRAKGGTTRYISLC